MDQKILDNVVKAVVQESLKDMGERKIPENDAKLSSAGVGKSLSVTSENRKMSPKEKSVKSPVREPHALEKSVKSPVTEPPQQKEKSVQSPVNAAIEGEVCQKSSATAAEGEDYQKSSAAAAEGEGCQKSGTRRSRSSRSLSKVQR